MTNEATGAPASLQVFRYRPGDTVVEAIIGEAESSLPQEDLIAHADEALRRETFMCYAVPLEDGAVGDELCFVPQSDHCDILSIHTSGWQRHHGDHRRSLVEILNNLAAAVACGRLKVLDGDQVAAMAGEGEPVLSFVIDDTAALARARDAVDEVLIESGLSDIERQRTILCISEAVTNMLLHGGGHGSMTLRRLPGRLRLVVADEGPGLNFLNWLEPPQTGGQASMGYGFKIILDYLDSVGLRTTSAGTTLILDRVTD